MQCFINDGAQFAQPSRDSHPLLAASALSTLIQRALILIDGRINIAELVHIAPETAEVVAEGLLPLSVRVAHLEAVLSHVEHLVVEARSGIAEKHVAGPFDWVLRRLSPFRRHLVELQHPDVLSESVRIRGCLVCPVAVVAVVHTYYRRELIGGPDDARRDAQPDVHVQQGTRAVKPLF